MKNKKILLVALLVIFGLQISMAQQVDTRNKIEYSQEEIEDINAISISKKKVKIEDEISVEDLERIVSKRRAKRYRKVRKNVEKCFKTEEEKECGK